MKNFVSVDWLKENFARDDLIIFDARAGLLDPEEGIRLYKEGHIKGAIFVSLEEVMTGELSKHGGRHPLPDLEKFREDMMERGLKDQSQVVIYDDGQLSMAGRLWWLLKYIGKEKVYILEGGYKKWLENKGNLSKDFPNPEKSESLSVNINHEMKVNMPYVRKAIDKESVAIVDARAHERYTGQVEPMDIKAGHIPSALNYPWTSLVIDGEITSKDKIKDYFKDLEEYEEIIVHCGSGVTATVDYIFMEEVGLKPKLYAGSFSDWISYDENEIIGPDEE